LFDPRDAAVNRLDIGKAKEDAFAKFDLDRRGDAATFGRKVDQLDSIARIAMTAKTDLALQWHAFGAPRFFRHFVLPGRVCSTIDDDLECDKKNQSVTDR